MGSGQEEQRSPSLLLLQPPPPPCQCVLHRVHVLRLLLLSQATQTPPAVTILPWQPRFSCFVITITILLCTNSSSFIFYVSFLLPPLRALKVLEESLTGAFCHTAVVGCVSPAARDLQMTLNTLRYAESLCPRPRRKDAATPAALGATSVAGPTEAQAEAAVAGPGPAAPPMAGVTAASPYHSTVTGVAAVSPYPSAVPGSGRGATGASPPDAATGPSEGRPTAPAWLTDMGYGANYGRSEVQLEVSV